MTYTSLGHLKLWIRNKFWRLRNKDNKTILGNNFPFEALSVGRGTYGTINLSTSWNSGKPALIIGSWCSIAEDVLFISHNDHDTSLFTTYPFHRKILHSGTDAITKGGIIVKDDVWIGARSTVLDGVTIGQGAVIACSAVVVNDVPPYSVVAGVPARVVKMRFNNELIEQMLKVNFDDIDEEFFRVNAAILERPISASTLQHLL